MIPYRLIIALKYFSGPFKALVFWLFKSKEFSNFTYDLDERNKQYLAAFLAQVTGAPYRTILGYLRELEEDVSLKEHLQRTTRASQERNVADAEPKYGRRLGWYALVRVVKPRVVVETGVDKGLGACVLAAALIKNREEGYQGRYYGTDINPKAGYLLQGRYAQVGEVLYGDSIESLKKLDVSIDLLINDSDHSADYEAREYLAVQDKLNGGAIIIGDNAHVSGKLLDFAEQTGRQFLFFKEQPRKHWYPGGGIGVSFDKP